MTLPKPLKAYLVVAPGEWWLIVHALTTGAAKYVAMRETGDSLEGMLSYRVRRARPFDDYDGDLNLAPPEMYKSIGLSYYGDE